MTKNFLFLKFFKIVQLYYYQTEYVKYVNNIRIFGRLDNIGATNTVLLMMMCVCIHIYPNQNQVRSLTT